MDTPNQPGVKLLFGMQPESTYLQWFETLKNSQSHLAIHPPEIRGGFLYLFQGDYSKRTFKDGRTKYTFKQSESKDISYNGKNYRRRSLTLQDQPVNSPKFILWTIGEIDPNNKKIELPLTLYHYRCDGDDNRSIFTSPEALKAHEDREAQPAPWTHSMVLDTQNTFLPADPDQSSVSSDGQASIDDWLSSYLDPDGTSSLGYSAANSPDSESKKRRLEEYPAQDGWKRFCGSLEVEEIVKAMDFVKHSDVRLKTNIQTIHDALPKVMQLRGVRYQWKDKPEKGDTVGFIAQEVAEIFPEFVHQDKNGYFGIDYTCFMAVLVQALHELQEQTRKELDHHANEITAVKIEVKELTTEVRTEIVDIKTSIGDLKSDLTEHFTKLKIQDNQPAAGVSVDDMIAKLSALEVNSTERNAQEQILRQLIRNDWKKRVDVERALKTFDRQSVTRNLYKLKEYGFAEQKPNSSLWKLK